MKIIKDVNIKQMIENNRESLKPDWKLWSMTKTDKKLKKEAPEVYKKQTSDEVVELKKEFDDELLKLMETRESKRRFKDIPISLDELSYLLYSVGKLKSEGIGWSKRIIPTAGATHNLETYLVVTNVEGLKQGLYRYMPDNGNIEFIKELDLKEFNESIFKQVRGSGVTVIWVSIPYRSEYKYSFTAHKMIAMEAGHACQNLYLAAENKGLGCVAIGAYYQDQIDRVLGFDGENEFVVYLATVGKI